MSVLGDDLPGGNPGALRPAERLCVRKVVEFYVGGTSQWPSDLVQSEDPWRLLERAGASAVSPFERLRDALAY